jgi:K+-sensing histidine kinase KdpD
MEGSAEFAKSRRVGVGTSPVAKEFVLGHEELLARALQSLIETAVKFSDAGESVQLSAGAEDDRRIVVIVESRGRTIPSSALPKFFDLFSIGEAITPGGDLGLGPPVAYRILSLFSASVSVANRDASGIRITVSLKPAPSPKSQSPLLRF